MSARERDRGANTSGLGGKKTKMKLKKELIKREIAGETILVPVGKTVYDSNGLFVLNELGNFIWEMLPNVQTEEEICKAILAEYEVSMEEAAADVAEFLSKLREMEMI
jgi:hypothetical protein